MSYEDEGMRRQNEKWFNEHGGITPHGQRKTITAGGVVRISGATIHDHQVISSEARNEKGGAE